MAPKGLRAAAILVLLCATPRSAASREIQLRVRYSGTAMSTQGDTNHDGLKAGLGTVACTSNLGPCTSQGVGEALLGDRATCPNGNQGFNLVLKPGTGHAVTRFARTGELLFSELTSETVCYDPTTRTQFKTGTEKITGGTGRFVGATGDGEFTGTQWVLYVDPDGNGFAAQVGTVMETIVLRR